jgi:hypothetical protein
MKNYLTRLSTDVGSAKIFVTGYAVKKASPEPVPNVHLFRNALEIKQLISDL